LTAWAPPGVANAAELHLVVHGLSKHPYGKRNSGRPYEEVNPGLGLSLRGESDFGIQAGALHNSYDRTTVYLIGEWTPATVIGVRAGLFAGLASGYPHNHHRFGPGGGVFLRAQGERLSATLRFVPPIGPVSGCFGIEVAMRL
jgi:hypothetical protein